MLVVAEFWHTAAMAKSSGFASGFELRFESGLGAVGRVAAVWVGTFAVVLGMAAWRGVMARAQDADVTTLHVYANTIQIPVLVLGEDRKKTAPIAPNRFQVSVDGGPPFRASHVRLEGDDPISLAILLDVSGPQEVLMPKVDGAIAKLASLSLRPEDRVSVYALDCKLRRSAENVVVSPELLKDAVSRSLQPWKDRMRNRHGTACQQTMHLWDALAYITNRLADQRGRRVILAVTDGNDKGSSNRWNEVRTFAQATAVAIFGMTYVPNEPGFLQGLNAPGFSQSLNSEDAFHSVCELSGGLVFAANRDTLDKRLTEFVAMVRGRYIVEFPRPYNSTRGQHQLMVTIDKSKAFIRSTGIAVPLQDAKVLSDPTTVRPDSTSAPEEGTRHILTPPQ
ncbi:hypothetical protein RBB79_14360 [Tunturiibacter empetritectus]|uniref:VWA domain-containing protein n=1 Tax=Tunturiibacter lichenicola TaxID=2051959 RepID=A0A852VGN9_9BACT|nr:hypothetical protein [Edaphobacter lichenicola]NYF90797.1 hypothetical protein [Edaphobacter lichenicola]